MQECLEPLPILCQTNEICILFVKRLREKQKEDNAQNAKLLRLHPIKDSLLFSRSIYTAKLETDHETGSSTLGLLAMIKNSTATAIVLHN